MSTAFAHTLFRGALMLML